MDLDKLKESWKNQPEDLNKVSKDDIHRMAHSKSSSIVKWIFIIGIAEFAFWVILNFIASRFNLMEAYEKLNLIDFLNTVYYINFVVVVGFLYYFYKNYTSISTVDSTKNLMSKIIKTRKTVKYYVNYNVIGAALIMIVFNIVIVNTPNGIETMLSLDGIELEESKLLSVYLISQAIAVAIMILFLFLFYYLLYGIMLKKLKRNHKELEKLEHLN